MLLACAVNALLLSTSGTVPLALSLAPAAQGSPQSKVLDGKDERAAQAADYYAKGRYVEASLEFEGLWRDFPGEPRFLFNAAASRYIAGHYAHTVAYLGEYLARKEIQGDDRKEAQAQLDEARRKVAPVRVTVTVPAGSQGEVKLTVQHVARGASDLRPELAAAVRRSATGAEAVLQLEPGSWTVRAQGEGYAATETRVEVKTLTGQEVALQLALAPVDAPVDDPAGPAGAAESGVPVAVAHRIKVGFAAAGGVSAALGVALVAVGTVKNSAASRCSGALEPCWDGLAGSLRMRAAGAGLIGGSVGLLAGGLTWISGDPRMRRKVWITEAAIGGAAVIGGAVWMQLSLGDLKSASTGNWTEFYQAHHVQAQHAAAGAVVGLGAGLLTSAITGLLVQRKFSGSKRTALRTLRLDGSAGPGRAGVVFSGRF